MGKRLMIAVLGANSFSGAAFCRYAAEAGHGVMPLRRPHHDLNTGLDNIMRAVDDAQPEYFVNFAALNMVGESWQFYDDYYRTNVLGVARLAQRLGERSFLKKFVQVSTPEVYGTTDVHLKEGAAMRPSTPYAVSRGAADLHLMALHATYAFPVCFTRSVNVYGPGQQAYRIIPKTVLSIAKGRRLQLHGGGVSTRSFLHINDVADSILRVMLEGRLGETYHTSTWVQTRIVDLVGKVCELMGVYLGDVIEPAPERPGKDMAYQLDHSKIRDELGWSPRITLDEGLAETVAWFKERAAQFDDAAMQYVHRP